VCVCVKWAYVCKDNDKKDYLVIVAVTSVPIKDSSFLLAESLKCFFMVLIAKFHIDCRYM